jgi:hypothetical protein
MPLGEQCDHELLDHVLLSDDHPLNLSDGISKELRGCLVSGLARRPSSWALVDRLAKRRTTHTLSRYSSLGATHTDTMSRPLPFAGHRTILADAGLQAMSLDKPQTVTGPITSCENG